MREGFGPFQQCDQPSIATAKMLDPHRRVDQDQTLLPARRRGTAANLGCVPPSRANITGISSQSDDLLGKLIQILHEVNPTARRIAIVLNESHPAHAVFWSAALAACAALGLVALRVVANTSTQFAGAVEQIVSQRSQAVVVIPDPLYFAERAKLQELLQATRLPVAYGSREHVVAGG